MLCKFIYHHVNSIESPELPLTVESCGFVWNLRVVDVCFSKHTSAARRRHAALQMFIHFSFFKKKKLIKISQAKLADGVKLLYCTFYFGRVITQHISD